MKLDDMKIELQSTIDNGSESDITAARGRLIRQYKSEIKKLNKKKNLSEDEQKQLNKLIVEMQNEINKHKIQLSARYHNEFINKKANIESFATILPNAVKLAVEKVKACMYDVKNASNRKEKINKITESIKSMGLLTATPIVYLGKFALDQWYVFAGAAAGVYLYNNPEKIVTIGKKALEFSGETALTAVKAVGKTIFK